MSEIKAFEALEGAALNDVKVRLADEATKLLHGEECLAEIHSTVKSLYSKGGGDDLSSLPQIQLEAVDISVEGNTSVVSVVDMLLKAGMAASKGEAKRLIKAGGAKVNDAKVSDEYATLDQSAFGDSRQVKLSSGKKKHAVVLWPASV